MVIISSQLAISVFLHVFSGYGCQGSFAPQGPIDVEDTELIQ